MNSSYGNFCQQFPLILGSNSIFVHPNVHQGTVMTVHQWVAQVKTHTTQQKPAFNNIYYSCLMCCYQISKIQLSFMGLSKLAHPRLELTWSEVFPWSDAKWSCKPVPNISSNHVYNTNDQQPNPKLLGAQRNNSAKMATIVSCGHWGYRWNLLRVREHLFPYPE